MDQIFAWWQWLYETRDGVLRQGSYGDQEEENSAIWKEVRWQLWYELTPTQQKYNDTKRTSVLDVILNKRVGWTYAARAIMETSLPQIEVRHKNHNVTEDVRVVTEVVVNMRVWFQAFAEKMVTFKEFPEYKEKLQASSKPSRKRRD